MDTKDEAANGLVQGLAADRRKAGRPAGSTSTARPMRQLTLAACLSPLANTARTSSPSVAAPAAPRTTKPEPSNTTANDPSALRAANSNAPAAPAKQKLNLFTPPKPARKSAAQGGAKASVKAQPNGAAPGREGARPARGFGFAAITRQAFGLASGHAAGGADTDTGCGRSAAPADPAPTAVAVAVPTELDRIGGDGARMERSSLLSARASARGSELVLADALPEEGAPGEEQQGESAGPTQEPPPGAPVAAAGPNGAVGTSPGLAEEVTRRLPQRDGGLSRRGDVRRGGLAGQSDSDSDIGGGPLLFRRRLRRASRSRVEDDDDSSEEHGAALNPGQTASDGERGSLEPRDGASGGCDAAGHTGRGATAAVAARAAVARAAGRPPRAAAERAKQLMKAGAAGTHFGDSQPSASASEGATAPAGCRRASETSEAARAHGRNGHAGVSACADDHAGNDHGGGGTADDDDAGDAAEACVPPQAAANTAARAASGGGCADSAIVIDASDVSDGAANGAARDDDAIDAVSGGAAANVAGGASASGGAAAATTSASLDLAGASHDGSAGTALAAVGAADDEEDDGEEQSSQQPPSLPEWDEQRPGYVDLAAAVGYRQAVARGEVEAAEELPSCWGAGLLGDKRVFCNTVLHGSAATVIQAAVEAALKGKLGKLNEQKLVTVDRGEVLTPKQAKCVQQQVDVWLRRAAAERMRRQQHHQLPQQQAAAAGQQEEAGKPTRPDWRALSNAEVLANLPEIIPPSKKIERVTIGEDGVTSPWDDVPEMRGQASLRVKPDCKLATAEVLGVYSGEGWLHPDWQEQGLVKPREEWDDPARSCPHRFTGQRRLQFGRYAADCSLPKPLLDKLAKLELPEARLRALVEKKDGSSRQLFMTAARLGCLLASANDPSRNLRAKCEAEADYREGGPNVEVINATVLGFLPLMVMVATKEVQGPQHIMYAYGLSYWELHEEDVAHCRELEELEAEAEAARSDAKVAQAAHAERKRRRLKIYKKLRHVEKREQEARTELEAARTELEAARIELEAARTELEAARTELEAARTEVEGARAEADAARAREEEERRSRMAAEVWVEAASRREVAAQRREDEERARRLATEEELGRLRDALPAAPPPPPPSLQQSAEELRSGANARSKPPEPVRQPGCVVSRLNWLPERGAAAAPKTSGGGNAGGRARPAPKGAAAAPAAAPTPGAGPGGDAAALPTPLRGLGSPLGKRNRAEDAVAEAELGSPTARHRTAAVPAQGQAPALPAPPLPSTLLGPQPPLPQPPSPPFASPAEPSPEEDFVRWGLPAQPLHGSSGGGGDSGGGSPDGGGGGERTLEGGGGGNQACAGGCGVDSNDDDEVFMDCSEGAALSPLAASAGTPASGRGGGGGIEDIVARVGCCAGDGVGHMAAAGHGPAATVNEPCSGGGGAAASRKPSRLMSRRTRDAVAAAAGAAGAPLEPAVPTRDPAGNAASRHPHRQRSVAGAAASTGQDVGHSDGAAGGSDGTDGAVERRAGAAVRNLGLAVEAAAMQPLPESPAAQGTPPPRPRRRPSQSQRQAHPDSDQSPDRQGRPPSGELPRGQEQPTASPTQQQPPRRVPSQMQREPQQHDQEPGPQRVSRGTERQGQRGLQGQRERQGQRGQGDGATGRSMRSAISGLRGQPMRYSTGLPPPDVEVLDLVDSD